MYKPRVRLRRETVEIALTKMNLSQALFARKLMMTSGAFSQYMTGTRVVSPHMRRKISAALKGYKWDEIYELMEE